MIEVILFELAVVIPISIGWAYILMKHNEETK